MTYQPETILKRKLPQEDEYDEVRVIGEALVGREVRPSEWTGSAANKISVAPTSFGSPRDLAVGELQRDYKIVSEPDPKQKVTPTFVPEDQDRETPEEKFKNKTAQSTA